MQPAREDVVQNLTRPASAASATARHGAMMSFALVTALAAWVAEVVLVAGLAEHGEDEPRHLRGRGRGRASGHRKREREEKESSGCRPGRSHRGPGRARSAGA